jgi:hypothetical protein
MSTVTCRWAGRITNDRVLWPNRVLSPKVFAGHAQHDMSSSGLGIPFGHTERQLENVPRCVYAPVPVVLLLRGSLVLCTLDFSSWRPFKKTSAMEAPLWHRERRSFELNLFVANISTDRSVECFFLHSSPNCSSPTFFLDRSLVCTSQLNC